MNRWFTDSTGCLRTGWRFLVFVALLMVLQTGAALLIAVALDTQIIPAELSVENALMISTQVLGVITVSIAVYVARRWLDQRSFVSLGLAPKNHWIRHIALGTLLGISLQALIFLIQLAAGWLIVEDLGWRGMGIAPIGLLAYAMAFLAVAWNEELLSRGYLLQNLERGLGTVAAVVVSSLIFGVLHILNPNATMIAAVGVTFAGLLLATAYLVTRSLWLPIGLHLGWNFGEGPLFGFPVSGIDAGGLLTLRVTGPEMITGGSFGPEAGVISVVAELIGIAILGVWWRRNRA